jgi:hypothetical protein
MVTFYDHISHSGQNKVENNIDGEVCISLHFREKNEGLVYVAAK